MKRILFIFFLFAFSASGQLFQNVKSVVDTVKNLTPESLDGISKLGEEILATRRLILETSQDWLAESFEWRNLISDLLIPLYALAVSFTLTFLMLVILCVVRLKNEGKIKPQ